MIQLGKMTPEQRKEVLGTLMENLKLYVGEEVIVIYWEGGSIVGVKAFLNNVETFDFINIEDSIVPFVGPKAAIQAVFDKDHHLLYYNDAVENYQGFSFKDIFGLMLAQEEILGYSADKERMEGINQGGR